MHSMYNITVVNAQQARVA